MTSGYKGVVELGYGIGTGNYGMDRLSLNIINGYQFNPFFSLGFGTGLRYYFDADALVVPFFAAFQVNFIDNEISPFFAFDIGYSFDTSYGFEPVGLLLNPKAGATFKVGSNNFINASFGYEAQNMVFYHYYYECAGDSRENSGAFNLSVGFVF